MGDHVVHPPDQPLPPLGDEVFLKATGGLLLGKVGYGDDREALNEPSVQPVKVLIPAGVMANNTGWKIYWKE